MKTGLLPLTLVTVWMSSTLTTEKLSTRYLNVESLENYLAMDLMESS